MKFKYFFKNIIKFFNFISIPFNCFSVSTSINIINFKFLLIQMFLNMKYLKNIISFVFYTLSMFNTLYNNI